MIDAKKETRRFFLVIWQQQIGRNNEMTNVSRLFFGRQQEGGSGGEGPGTYFTLLKVFQQHLKNRVYKQYMLAFHIKHASTMDSYVIIILSQNEDKSFGLRLSLEMCFWTQKQIIWIFFKGRK